LNVLAQDFLFPEVTSTGYDVPRFVALMGFTNLRVHRRENLKSSACFNLKRKNQLIKHYVMRVYRGAEVWL
jgi:hypothetical protein